MKYMVSIALLCIASILNVQGQDSKEAKQAAKKAEVKGLIDSQNFDFIPTSVSPLRGSTRQITYSYDLKVSKDTINSYLPYFGRAYNADYGSTNGGLDFKSTDFEYTTTPRKKSGWNIIIKLKDVRDPRELNFTISENGFTTLNVTSNNRDAISFNGEITAQKKPK